MASTGHDMEGLIHDMGGFGKFQILIIAALFYNKMCIAWSTLQMSYAGYIPDWHCGTVASSFPSNQTAPGDDTTFKECDVNHTWTNYQKMSCDKFVFEEDSNTAITEWDLLCDRKYIKQSLIAIQMAGLMLGCFISGQLSDRFGRKKTVYSFVLYHCLANILTAFSVSWEMFAVCRMLIGFGIGGILVVLATYALEFTPQKWRPLLPILPIWVTGVSVFALFALLLENWSHLHIACGVFGLPGVLGYLYVPESMRWLAVKGRIKEAHEICEKIASVNRKDMPTNAKSILENVFKTEMENRETAKKYTYVDVFKGWPVCKITLTFAFFWFAISLIYYGLSFGVSSLSGNLYLNIFLLAIVDLPAQFSTFYFMNKIGRRKTAFILTLIAFIAAIALLVINGVVQSKGAIITALSLTVKMGVGACWRLVITWGLELYPTVTRNLGFGVSNTAARLGGIIAPFALDLDDQKTIAFSIVLGLIAIVLLLILTTPETMGKALADTMEKGDKYLYNGSQKQKDSGVFSVSLQDDPKKTNAESEKKFSDANGTYPTELNVRM